VIGIRDLSGMIISKRECSRRDIKMFWSLVPRVSGVWSSSSCIVIGYMRYSPAEVRGYLGIAPSVLKTLCKRAGVDYVLIGYRPRRYRSFTLQEVKRIFEQHFTEKGNKSV